MPLNTLQADSVLVESDFATRIEPGPVGCGAGEWNAHWQAQRTSLFGLLCSLYRRHLRARSVAYYFDRYFPTTGRFAECGCGSSETSCRLPHTDRYLIGVDWAEEALSRAGGASHFQERVRADIRHLPFDRHSLDGIWNLGVMEHFEEDDQAAILREFCRVLKPGGHILIWWPPRWALDRCVLAPLGWRFPAEPGRINKSEARDRLIGAGFEDVTIDFPVNDGFTELVLHATAGHGSGR